MLRESFQVPVIYVLSEYSTDYRDPFDSSLSDPKLLIYLYL